MSLKIVRAGVREFYKQTFNSRPLLLMKSHKSTRYWTEYAQPTWMEVRGTSAGDGELQDPSAPAQGTLSATDTRFSSANWQTNSWIPGWTWLQATLDMKCRGRNKSLVTSEKEWNNKNITALLSCTYRWQVTLKIQNLYKLRDECYLPWSLIPVLIPVTPVEISLKLHVYTHLQEWSCSSGNLR